jgi:uncharacterized protein DUF3618
MGTTEAELRREAELERARMGETLEAIGDRLSPERMVERRKAAMGQGFRRMREAVMGSPEYVEPVVRTGRESASSAMSSAADTARSVADKVQHAPEAMTNRTAGNPLAAGLIAFGAGLLIASAFPSTRTEQRLAETAQPQLEKAKAELRDAGQQVTGDLRETAKSAVQETASGGRDAMTNVTDEARSSAQTVADKARGETQS